VPDPERLRFVTDQCQRICDLIREAERAPDPARAKVLYLMARSLTQEISEIVRDCLAPMVVAHTAFDDAA